MNKKKSISREESEMKEGLDTIKNQVPENRMQSDQQIQNTDAAQDVKPAESSFTAKKTTAKGDSLKQQVISDAITGSNSSAGIGVNAAGRAVSGTVGGILGANNSTPQAGQSRSDSRTGKKLDRVATKLNYTPSEQAILAVDESKPLADSSNEDQGYNGTYRNEAARSQKIMGAVPADLMYQRSVDFIMKDKLYFAEGQQVYQTGDSRTSYDPQRVYDVASGKYVPTSIHAGNYLHRKLHFGLTTAGQVEYFYADVDDVTPEAVTPDEANCASAHRLIKSNIAELDRMSMDAKAGDEKAEIWSPLPRGILDPTAWSFLMSSIEGDTGAYAYLAYSKASTNFSYQLNRGPKDGLNIITPAIEQCVGWRSVLDESKDIGDAYDNTLHSSTDEKKVFSAANYILGDPSLMIAAYDTVGKYNNKADLLLQPRGWRMHLQTADNNINALKVPTELINVIAATETFSTIDREYDPLLPICMTDKANLITVHNFNELAGFAKDFGVKNIKLKFSCTKVAATYESVDVKILKANSGAVFKGLGYGEHIYLYYKKPAGQDAPVWDYSTGILKWDADSANITNGEFEVLVSSTASLAGYTALKSAADSYIFDNYNLDVIFKQPVKQDDEDTVISALAVTEIGDTNWYYNGCRPLVYKYSDLRNNYFIEMKHPLIFGMVEWLNESIGGKIRSLIGQRDFQIPMIFSTQYMTLAQLAICAATPWIQRVRQNSMKDVIYYEDNIKEYPYSKLDSIKNTPFKNFVNFSYTDYDHPLETKIMNPVQAINWTMPEFFWKIGTRKFVLPWYFNENDLNADGSVNDDANTMSMPSIRSGIRLSFLDNLYGMTEKDIRLSLDRMTKSFLNNDDFDYKYSYKYGKTTDGQIVVVLDELRNAIKLGEILKCPRELGLGLDAPLGVLTLDPDDVVENVAYYKTLGQDGTSTSYRIKIFTNVNTSKSPSILSNDGVNISRAANYTQKWFELLANGSTSNVSIAGLVFGMNDDAHQFAPFAELGSSNQVDLNVTLDSYMRSVNTRLQFLPFVISPFDGVALSGKSHDIYDFAYWFGLAGFRASDYRESVYNRSKEVINQGFLFTDDPWVLDSPIIKGASASTGVKDSKGYLVK